MTTPDSGSMRDLNDEEMKEFTFEHPAVVFEYDEHHGGDDVGLWATGPMSYLFHKSHEQSYVAHVVGDNFRSSLILEGDFLDISEKTYG